MNIIFEKHVVIEWHGECREIVLFLAGAGMQACEREIASWTATLPAPLFKDLKMVLGDDYEYCERAP